MSGNRFIVRKHKMANNRKEKIKLQKHLNADALFANVRNGFENISDQRKSNATIALADALMAGLRGIHKR